MLFIGMFYIQMMDLKEAYRIQQRGYEAAEADRVARLRARSHDDWLNNLRTVWSVKEPDQDFFRTAMMLQRALRKEEIRFCFIGGLVLQHWGEVRITNDIDLTALCDLGQESAILEKLRRIVTPRIDDIEWLVRNARMYLGITDDETQVDISLGFTPYEHHVMERAVDVDFGVEEPLRCCSAEDLVVLKTVAGRGQDWVDLVRIIQHSGKSMDWDLVFSELTPLLELTETPESAERLRELMELEK